MKTKVLLTILLSLLTIYPVSAQDTDMQTKDQPAVIQDVEGLRTEFKQNLQDPATKIVKFEMIIKSGIDSDRIRITWTAEGSNTFVDESQTIRTGVVKKGGTYTIPIELKISGNGVHELFGKVEAFKADVSYIATVRKNFASNNEGEILPLTNEYNNAKTFNFIKTILLATIVFFATVFLLFVGFKRFVKWLNRDDRK